jgi:uncharacterized protein involved in exopolysaccharide biosynthesis
LPPEKESGSLGLASSLLPSGISSMLGGGGLSLPGLATPSDLYAAILKSNIVCKAVVDNNNLKKVYDVNLDEIAIKELLFRTKISVEPEGIISLSYEDTNPVRAAAVANSFIESLNKVNQENIVSKARSTREFVEQRLKETVHDLAAAEEAYKNFQENHNAVSLPDQVKAVINAIADLRGQQVIAEIEFGVMKKSLSPSNTRYQDQEYKIEQIKVQLEKLERGDTITSSGSVLNIPMKQTPELSLELARLTRDLKIQETVFELLKQQYEEARIQEMRDTPTLQVLDRAEEPRMKSRPKRTVIAALSGVLSFGMTLILVITLEFVRREKSTNSIVYQRLSGITQMLNDDFYWIRNIFNYRKKKNVN